jgi:hypothetical protein
MLMSLHERILPPAGTSLHSTMSAMPRVFALGIERKTSTQDVKE